MQEISREEISPSHALSLSAVLSDWLLYLGTVPARSDYAKGLLFPLPLVSFNSLKSVSKVASPVGRHEGSERRRRFPVQRSALPFVSRES